MKNIEVFRWNFLSQYPEIGKGEHIKHIYTYIHTFDNEILFLDCTEPAILEFPKDFLSEEVRNNGGIIIHVILATYLIFGLGTICDDFFVPVLEIISEKFHLSNDVAGATFMAAGKYVLVLYLLLLSVKDRVPKTRTLGSRLT